MTEVTYLEAIRQAMWEEMERDPRVILLGEDVGLYGGAFKVTAGFLERFGKDRIIDTPISEEGYTGVAIGAAFNGLRPIGVSVHRFTANAFNMITNLPPRAATDGAECHRDAGSFGGGVGRALHSRTGDAFRATPGSR
jgi:2-oxoisovalerate dehydrogenase E1 component beta subunit